ncbi:MAG: nucleoside triphosphate pyrophosphohydrolase [Chloroflexi bacterium]|nr:nucleoside triphosphate pyrophosphohydrolase [Chloroflexota bacterium]
MNEARPSERQSPPPFQHLTELIARLYSPDQGCPWCLEQSHQSLRDYLVEEAYEVAEAIDQGEPAQLAEELADVLTLVLTHAELAGQAGTFNLADIAEAGVAKTVRRNPHIFGSATATTTAEVLRQWEAIKQSERGDRVSVLTGVSPALPALVRAQSLQSRAAHVGFDWPTADGVIDKVREEAAELQAAAPSEQEEELGDLLFTLVNLARHLGLSAEQALQSASEKFSRRFQAIEAVCRSRGILPEQLSLQELDEIWDRVKAEET